MIGRRMWAFGIAEFGTAANRGRETVGSHVQTPTG